MNMRYDAGIAGAGRSRRARRAGRSGKEAVLRTRRHRARVCWLLKSLGGPETGFDFELIVSDMAPCGGTVPRVPIGAPGMPVDSRNRYQARMDGYGYPAMDSCFHYWEQMARCRHFAVLFPSR